MSRTLTYQQLVDKGACPSALAKFRALFGDVVEVTEELALRHAADFSWYWAAGNLLSDPGYAEHYRILAPANAKYKRIVAIAYAEYARATAPANVKYNRVTDPTYAEYERVTAAAYAEYKRGMATARAEYDRVRAPTWARLYIAR